MFAIWPARSYIRSTRPEEQSLLRHYRSQIIEGYNQWQLEKVLEQLSKELSGIADYGLAITWRNYWRRLWKRSKASAMEFQLNALWVKRWHGCFKGTYREPRKRNVRRLKPIPEDWWRDIRPGRLIGRYSELQTVWIGDISVQWIAIKNWKSQINPVTNPNTISLITLSLDAWQYVNVFSDNR
jgi:hypothetical protein